MSYPRYIKLLTDWKLFINSKCGGSTILMHCASSVKLLTSTWGRPWIQLLFQRHCGIFVSSWCTKYYECRECAIMGRGLRPLDGCTIGLVRRCALLRQLLWLWMLLEQAGVWKPKRSNLTAVTQTVGVPPGEGGLGLRLMLSTFKRLLNMLTVE